MKKSIICLLLLAPLFNIYAQKADDIKKIIKIFNAPNFSKIHIFIAKVEDNGASYYTYSYLMLNTSSGEKGGLDLPKIKSNTKQELIKTMTKLARGILHLSAVSTERRKDIFRGLPSTAKVTPLSNAELKELNQLLKKIRKENSN